MPRDSRRFTSKSTSRIGWRFIPILRVISRASTSSSAAVAVTPRLPRMISLSRSRVHPMRSANAACVTRDGFRNSSRRISPEWMGFFGACVSNPFVTVDNVDLKRLASLPTVDQAPLLVDPDRELTHAIEPEPFAPVPERHPKVAHVFSLVHVQHLSASALVQARRQLPHRGREALIERCGRSSGSPA